MKTVKLDSLLLNFHQSIKVSSLLVIFVLLEIFSLYDALAVIILSLPILLLYIGISILFSKFSINSIVTPVICMLCGALTVIFSVFGAKLHYNVFTVSLCAVMLSTVFSYKCKFEKDCLSENIKSLLKSIGLIAVCILLWGTLREFLATGSVLNTFITGGIKIFPKKFGNYIYTDSCSLLIFSFINFLLLRFKRNTNERLSLKGYAFTVVLSAFLGLIISLLVFVFSKFNIPGLTTVIPFLLAAIISTVISVYVSQETARLSVSIILYFVVICTRLSSVFIATLILSLIVFIITATVTYISDMIYRRNGNVSHILFVCFAVTFLYETITSAII